MDVDLHGAELASYLANHLNDLEFELLVRARIAREFNMAHSIYPQFEENHNECRFVVSSNDASKWHCSLGSTYRDCVSLNGEVLSTTMHNLVHQYRMQHGNKLSLLLPAPDQAPIESDKIPF